MRFCIVILMGICLASFAWAGSLRIVWDANTESDLQGYRVYWGTASKKYTWQKDVGLLTQCEISDLRDGITYYIAVTAVDEWGNESAFSQEASATLTSGGNPSLPETIQLSSNYPNPFNPSTYIDVALPERQFVNVTIFNGNGQLVKRLHSGFLDAGVHPIVWDACDESGTPVTAGIYFCRLETKDKVLTQAMTLLR